MEGKEEKKMTIPSSTSHSETQLTYAVTTDIDSDTFYTKLTQLVNPSGLNLIFNVRESLLDLYLLYLEVTKRGGYQQVTKERKWCEVVAAMKLEDSNAKLLSLSDQSDQLARIYCYLLYQYEKLYFYRSPPKQATTSTTEEGLTKRKRNSMASLSEDCSSKMTGADCVQKPVLLQAPPNDKKKKKRVGAPSGHSGYHIFLKEECARLKSSRQDIDGRRILRVAVDTWSNMSVNEKQPYVEESKKCKEKSKEAMITNEKQQSREDRKCEEKKPSVCGETGGD